MSELKERVEEVVSSSSNTSQDKSLEISDEESISKEKSTQPHVEVKQIRHSDDDHKSDEEGIHEEVIIITGADASNNLLSLRDDKEPALSFRCVALGSLLSCFQAVMYQIYSFKPTSVAISGTFIVLIAYFAGCAWAALLPRGDKFQARWRQRNGPDAALPRWITILSFFNHGPWNLKEHAICAITATSASNGAASVSVFAAQDLFYDLPLSTTTVVLSTVSIGLFGYGVAGLVRPFAVWDVDAVYWGTLPTVKTLQGLHWQDVKDSKPIRWFWYSFTGMSLYEVLPAYVFPWLNSISIPCLAAMNATGAKAAVLTNLFGGATNNEGLGLFSISLDWQYITSYNTSLPLTLQAHAAVGYFICFLAMLGIYYNNVWDAKSQPFMSTRLRAADGTVYPIAKVFVGGVLDETALAKYGMPMLTGTYAWAVLMANAAIGALLTHCVLFHASSVKKAYTSIKTGVFNDRHHTYMSTHYAEVPWWWYISVLVFSFVLGLIVVTTQNVSLPVWAYVFALLMGMIIAPFSALIYSRFGNGIATNNLSKMVAGLMLPGRPIGNMYFAAWSHNVINNTINLCNDLKMGEYLKIPPRTMFLTQIYGTVLGSFVNYAVMTSIVSSQRDLLLNSDGNTAWSGAQIQSYNTNATSWALAEFLYGTGKRYAMVPIGLAFGSGLVVIHWGFSRFYPILTNLNLAQLLQYSGFIPYNASQTSPIFSQILAGFFIQFYLRNYKPRIFKDYSYLVTGAFDGASLTVLFVLSFAVFGAGTMGAKEMKAWWGNNSDQGNFDHCPVGK